MGRLNRDEDDGGWGKSKSSRKNRNDIQGFGRKVSGSDDHSPPSMPNTPATNIVWIVFCVMAVFTVIYPFASYGIATLEKPSIHMQAGVPTEEVAQKVRAQIDLNRPDLLKADEKLLWVGMPEPGREMWDKWFFLPFGIFWTLFSIFWTALAMTAVTQSRNFAGLFMVLWGTPFVGVGFWMLSMPYSSYKEELHTVYAVTDNRAIKMHDSHVSEVVRFDSKNFGPLEVSNLPNGRMNVLFRSHLDDEVSPPKRRTTGGYWGVEAGEKLVDILNQKLETKPAVDPEEETHHHHRHKHNK